MAGRLLEKISFAAKNMKSERGRREFSMGGSVYGSEEMNRIIASLQK
ncbi:hypothetical protein B4168_1659 [Anoxybacillus flavithermus]|nr:hypothetical protein B4168_1659 [Anoxybacillus flavithermus]OAO84314.1 hypothetical protein GT23_3849 [Parageobacillus thermoglucosidasius]